MKRPHYRTKAQWAATTAAKLRAQEALHAGERIPSANWRAIRAKAAALASLRREAQRFEQMAQRFALEGV